MDYNKDFLKKLYFEMLRIRRTEKRLIKLFNDGHIKAPIHLSIGQEAVAVGVMAALRPEDKIVSTHRCHAHYLAKGGDMKKMFAEILGKATGCAKGKGGTMHLFDEDAGHVISAPIVGASISFAVGLALSFKMKDEDKIAVAFFGDGAVEEGIFWESINFASTHHLPILFVCENNLYATHSHILKRQPSEEITSRVAPYINSRRINNANDIWHVIEVVKPKVDLVRKGQPCFIEACTYRLHEHWGVGYDWDLGYRSYAEGEKWAAKGPFEKLDDILSMWNVGRGHEEMEIAIGKEIDEAEEFALNSPAPSEKELLTEVDDEKNYL